MLRLTSSRGLRGAVLKTFNAECAKTAEKNTTRIPYSAVSACTALNITL